MMIWKRISLIYLGIILFYSPLCVADFLTQTKVTGNIRSYYFTRNYSRFNVPNQSAFSLGGMLNIESAEIHGWSGDLAYYVADNMGLNSNNPNHRDITLPAKSMSVLGQSYLQYKQAMWLVRGGNQLIITPWLNAADTRMIPATYQGIYAQFTPSSLFEFTAMRITEFKGRASNEFNKTNLYIPGNAGGLSVQALGHTTTIGVLAGGLQYQPSEQLKSQVWYYKFYDFANLAYGDAEYIIKNKMLFNPFIGAQVATEWGEGKNYLKTDATLYGLALGLEHPNGRFLLGYDDIPVQKGAFKQGDIVSPYTAGYISDPLYTTSMIAGLVEKAAGHAYKIGGYYYLSEQRWRLAASYAKYFTASASVPNTNELDVDITYTFKHHVLQGLSLRNRLGILNNYLNTAGTGSRFIYNRVMVQYSFA